jgi:putative FmdB family regulatory protein
MPIYEYQCRDCGHRFSRLQKVGADAESVACPACGAQQAERQLSTFAASSRGSASSSPAPGCGSGGFT